MRVFFFFNFSVFCFEFFFIRLLFLAVLGLCCHAGFSLLQRQRAGLLSSCGVWELIALVLCRAQVVGCGGSALVEWGLVTLQRVGASRIRDRTRVPCIGRRLLNQWTTREALHRVFIKVHVKILPRLWLTAERLLLVSVSQFKIKLNLRKPRGSRGERPREKRGFCPN